MTPAIILVMTNRPYLRVRCHILYPISWSFPESSRPHWFGNHKLNPSVDSLLGWWFRIRRGRQTTSCRRIGPVTRTKQSVRAPSFAETFPGFQQDIWNLSERSSFAETFLTQSVRAPSFAETFVIACFSQDNVRNQNYSNRKQMILG
jgi:hypothetical protein